MKKNKEYYIAFMVFFISMICVIFLFVSMQNTKYTQNYNVKAEVHWDKNQCTLTFNTYNAIMDDYKKNDEIELLNVSNNKHYYGIVLNKKKLDEIQIDNQNVYHYEIGLKNSEMFHDNEFNIISKNQKSILQLLLSEIASS